ncbi:TetR/AcrR family transcriptional regulator [Clostridium sp. D2Q-14]|uniref:TetR/AcrR family transcriptional regulator n=1 Tax=Anaeromonas gelatinilytica TaxID=2683194 RepID=UPI00193C27FC|nr:TetR/AcrR family transcriptional regulator [Anaeromonas gelatinilytica]MBS4534921.1 TetR/AcrR family transcriptional regulator [Anaeromonas gelatinilytica]
MSHKKSIRSQKEIDIIEGSVKVFSKKGYYKAKMQDIANEASVGKGTLYEYFNGKRHLFEEMIMYSINNYGDKLKEVINESTDLIDTLNDIARFHGKFINDHLDMAQNIVNSSIDISDDMRNKVISTRDILLSEMVKYIKKIKQKGLIREDVNERVLVIGFFGTLNQFYTDQINMKKKKFEDIDPYPVINIILNGIL